MQKFNPLMFLLPGLFLLGTPATKATLLGSPIQSPNIIWISCEDISPHLGCYGDKNAITPNIDQLANSSIRYTNAFTTAGVCAPCRSAIITGVYQSTLGTHHMRCNAQLPKGVKPFPVYLRKAGYYCTNNSKQDYQFKTPSGVWDDSSKKAHWKNRQDPEQPFFSVFNFTGCHESGIASESKYKQVTQDLTPQQRQDAAQLTLPPYYPDTPIVREDWKRNYELITAMDAWAGKLIQELKDAGEYENTIIMYWSDHGVGLPRAKRWLYDSGTHIPLIVKLPDGLNLENRIGIADDELISSLDFAPTVLKLAGLKPPSHMQGRAFLGTDLQPPRNYVYGARDRMDERYDIIRSVRDQKYRYIRNYEPHKAYYQYMNTPEKGATMKELRRVHALGKLSTEAKLFMQKSKPAEELYDLQSDPHEVNNLIGDSKYSTVLERLRNAHLEWVVDTRDIGLIPESEIQIRELNSGARYNILKNAKPDLIEQIRNTANLAVNNHSDFGDLKDAANHSDSIVRYWALIGIGNRPDEATSCKSLLVDALTDSSPCVRIAASRALLKINEPRQALSTLKNELTGEHQWARLRAAIVLDESGEVARPLIPELKRCLKDQPNKYITRVANRTLNVLLDTNNAVK
ncbi:sulfatase-like hydrolase/transferase [Mariniblastus sp.]|mgnify:CR=1 FL=1|nr:sulfatase-like hydrolase/transferase [Mariniblastus sp.]MDA7910338.1 sulfatase-like hydrolase/transferase [bacterium]MDA7903673.1 sulfatase-like hydrolase/transferase [Mariniblastus sp.]MDA7906585.1 sulfatase-like hydrolase/transferase [Mariniblastus sp.]MDB4380133.1 sulfatase-like hydrolase/transferase [Mariniblastus sp.]